MRISRPCYDKYHRCPGYAGGGLKHAKRNRCPGAGYITWVTTTYGGDQEKRLYLWRLNRCPKCRVIVLPFLIRWLDYSWWAQMIRTWQQDLAYWLEERKEKPGPAASPPETRPRPGPGQED
jgi:hypothetical protein